MLALESDGTGAMAVGGSIGIENNRVGLRTGAPHKSDVVTTCPADLFHVTRVVVAHSPDYGNGRKA
jgi:hypothetical protein